MSFLLRLIVTILMIATFLKRRAVLLACRLRAVWVSTSRPVLARIICRVRAALRVAVLVRMTIRCTILFLLRSG